MMSAQTPGDDLDEARANGKKIGLAFSDGEQCYMTFVEEDQCSHFSTERGQLRTMEVFRDVAATMGWLHKTLTLTDVYDLRGEKNVRLSGFAPMNLVNGKPEYVM